MFMHFCPSLEYIIFFCRSRDRSSRSACSERQGVFLSTAGARDIGPAT